MSYLLNICLVPVLNHLFSVAKADLRTKCSFTGIEIVVGGIVSKPLHFCEVCENKQ